MWKYWPLILAGLAVTQQVHASVSSSTTASNIPPVTLQDGTNAQECSVNANGDNTCASPLLDDNNTMAIINEESTTITETSNAANLIQEYSEASLELSSPASSVVDPFGSEIGVAQIIDAVMTTEMLERLEQAQNYVKNEVMVDPKYVKVRNICRNQHEYCTYWAVLGEVSIILCFCVSI
jgi:hypothetical protein